MPAAPNARTDSSSRAAASLWRRSESDESQCSSRLFASAGATTTTSAPSPARYRTSLTTPRAAQVSFARTRIRRGRAPEPDGGDM